MDNKKLLHVFNTMHTHLGTDGVVPKVTRHTRAVAVANAQAMGITQAEHALYMLEIADIHRGKTRAETRTVIEQRNLNGIEGSN